MSYSKEKKMIGVIMIMFQYVFFNEISDNWYAIIATPKIIFIETDATSINNMTEIRNPCKMYPL